MVGYPTVAHYDCGFSQRASRSKATKNCGGCRSLNTHEKYHCCGAEYGAEPKHGGEEERCEHCKHVSGDQGDPHRK